MSKHHKFHVDTKFSQMFSTTSTRVPRKGGFRSRQTQTTVTQPQPWLTHTSRPVKPPQTPLRFLFHLSKILEKGGNITNTLKPVLRKPIPTTKSPTPFHHTSVGKHNNTHNIRGYLHTTNNCGNNNNNNNNTEKRRHPRDSSTCGEI